MSQYCIVSSYCYSWPKLHTCKCINSPDIELKCSIVLSILEFVSAWASESERVQRLKTLRDPLTRLALAFSISLRSRWASHWRRPATHNFSRNDSVYLSHTRIQCKASISNTSSSTNLFLLLLPQNSPVFYETKCNWIAFNSRIRLTY